MRKLVAELAAVLADCGEDAGAAKVAARGSEEELVAFLKSNELWGGSGSIADQAGGGGGRTDQTRRIEAVLIKLGTEQMKKGVVNVRTANWVNAFKQWAERGI